MDVTLDIGNSETVVGVYRHETWVARWRLQTDQRRTADEYGLWLRELFAGDGLSPGDVSGVVIGSVVPVLTPVLATVCTALFGSQPLVVGPGVATGMPVEYQPPSALGSDRLADAVAARERYGAPVVAVDFGTATTFNVVDANGTFKGGAIAPGLRTAAEALAEAGARLRPVDLESGEPLPLIGRNTEQSMRSGVIHGYAALVDGLLARIDAALALGATAGPSRAPVVATGGMARVLAHRVARIDHIEPNLTLDGLRLILGRQRHRT